MGTIIEIEPKAMPDNRSVAVYSCIRPLGDVSRARRLVAKVRRNQKALLVVGAALYELEQGDLWKAVGGRHRTFKAFCSETFGFTRDYGYKLINAHRVQLIWRRGIASGTLKKQPTSEASLRPFTALRDNNGNLNEDLILNCAKYCEIQAGPSKPVTQATAERAVSKYRKRAAAKENGQTLSDLGAYLAALDRARQVLDRSCDELRHLAQAGALTEEARLAALATLDRIDDATGVHREKLGATDSLTLTPGAKLAAGQSPSIRPGKVTTEPNLGLVEVDPELVELLKDDRRCSCCESPLRPNEDEQCEECQEEQVEMCIDDNETQ